jgi:hypothetical protein
VPIIALAVALAVRRVKKRIVLSEDDPHR